MDENYYNIYYIVIINEKQVEDPRWFKTTCGYAFCGKLINFTNGILWFELAGCGALVAVPAKWIKSIAPSKAKWNEIKEENK
jgi:hypothetical protein